MPAANPQHYRGLVEGITRADGVHGWIVRKHWVVTAWWLAAVFGYAGVVTALWLYLPHRLAGIVGVLGAISLVFWRFVITRTYLLVTERGVYKNYVSKFERNTDVLHYGDSPAVRCTNEGWNLVRSKTVIVTAAGNDDGLFRIRYPHAGGGDAMTAALNRLISS